MLARIMPIAAGVSLMLAACAAPSGESLGSGDDALTNGVATTYPIVEITNPNGWPCSGTALTDSWVLTSGACVTGFGVGLIGSTVSVCGPLGCTNGTILLDPNFAGALLHLNRTITAGPYPLVSNFPVSDVYPLTCAGVSSSHGPQQASFTISGVTSSTFHATPTGGAMVEHSDMGGGCFASNTLYGVVDACDPGTNQCTGLPAQQFGDFVLANVVTAPFCGTATCGLYQAGSHQISCGTCASGQTCNAGTCVSLPPPSTDPPPPQPCPRGMKDCGDGTCVPRRMTCG